jgi:beta-phosphoglucomutase
MKPDRPMCGIIFDMDGVLVDSARPHLRSWQLVARELGRDVTDGQFRATFGRQNRDIVPLLFGCHDDESIRRVSDRKEQLYRDLIRNDIPAVDGAAELVRRCRQSGFRLAVGSSGPPENVDLVLDGMEIRGFFDAVVTARQVTRGKPDPQVFQLAASAMGVSPRWCAVVEDAPSGIDAALAAGATVIALAGTHPVDTLQRAQVVVTSLRQLSPSSIRELVRRHAAKGPEDAAHHRPDPAS